MQTMTTDTQHPTTADPAPAGEPEYTSSYPCKMGGLVTPGTYDILFYMEEMPERVPNGEPRKQYTVTTTLTVSEFEDVTWQEAQRRMTAEFMQTFTGLRFQGLRYAVK